jgi:hypothetical protein
LSVALKRHRPDCCSAYTYKGASPSRLKRLEGNILSRIYE